MKKNLFCFLILLLVLIINNSQAQDTIFLKNNQRIPANIIEVSSTEVKYKRFEISEGPVYIERKSMIIKIKYKNGFTDVFPEENETTTKADVEYRQSNEEYKSKEYKSNPRYPDLYEWGRGKYMYGDKVIGEGKMHQVLLSLNDVKITEQVMNARQSKAMKYIGFAAIPLGIGCALYAFRSENINYFYNRSMSAYSRERYKRNAIVLGGGAVLCFGASIYFGIDRRNKNRMAVQMYQEHYAKR